MNFNYQKVVVPDRLKLEIEESAITVALDYITTTATDCTIYFKGNLTQGEIDTLAALVAAHVATPLPDNQVRPVAVVSKTVFADPEYRTKWDATSAVVEVPANQSAPVDFQLNEERYISGGMAIVKNAELGDWVEGMIYDKDNVIPEPYRAATCEGHPVVNKYVLKMYINPILGQGEIDTAPLSAKVSAGLYVRLIYHAVNSGQTRQVVMNLKMSKKL